ncbi:MAG TPA: hypothetical protein ENJ19_04665 [Gammaproteobacteria bacterium]|nr:hypothetical protein [Gammaproteobacteria bacterium]
MPNTLVMVMFVRFGVMTRVLVFMPLQFIFFMLVIVSAAGVVTVAVFMLMAVRVAVGVPMGVFVLRAVSVSVFMLVLMTVLMVVFVSVFVFSFHCKSP